MKRFKGGGVLSVSGYYRLAWSVDSTGKIVGGFNKIYQLKVLSSDGKVKFKFGRDFKLKIRPNYKKKSLYKYCPAFGKKILFDENGNIWIEQYIEKERKATRTYDLFSEEGIYLKQVRAPFRFHHFANGRVYGISKSRADDDFLIKCSRIVSGLEMK